MVREFISAEEIKPLDLMYLYEIAKTFSVIHTNFESRLFQILQYIQIDDIASYIKVLQNRQPYCSTGYSRHFWGKVRKILFNLIKISEAYYSVLVIDANRCFISSRQTFQHSPLFLFTTVSFLILHAYRMCSLVSIP